MTSNFIIVRFGVGVMMGRVANEVDKPLTVFEFFYVEIHLLINVSYMCPSTLYCRIQFENFIFMSAALYVVAICYLCLLIWM